MWASCGTVPIKLTRKLFLLKKLIVQHALSTTLCKPVLTINVPVVFMVLRGATSLREILEGVGPENRDFFGP
jgi:hypothetical protein